MHKIKTFLMENTKNEFKIDKNNIGGKMKRMFVLTFLLLVSINAFALKINEFIVNPNESEAIELYNETGASIDVANYRIYVVGTTTTDSTTFKTFTIAAGGYKSFTMDTANFVADKGFPNDGAIIKIYNASGTLLDSVGY
ncbi:MAG: lamin tail domain-containing protein, partial [bacterium]